MSFLVKNLSIFNLYLPKLYLPAILQLMKAKKEKIKRNYTHPDEPRYADLTIAQPKISHKKTFEIVSYNIRFSERISQAIKLFSNYEIFKTTDILCLQEMDHDSVKIIAEHLKMNYVYYPAVIHPKHNRDFGNAILSHWPIHKDKKIILPTPGNDKRQRIAVSAEIDLNGNKVIVFCIHLRVLIQPIVLEEQMRHLINNLPPSIKYCILAGDFNTFTKKSRSSLSQLLKVSDFQLATEDIGWSFTRWALLNKKSQLDHIFTKGIDILKTGKVIDQTASDHIPIWVNFQLWD